MKTMVLCLVPVLLVRFLGVVAGTVQGYFHHPEGVLQGRRFTGSAAVSVQFSVQNRFDCASRCASYPSRCQGYNTGPSALSGWRSCLLLSNRPSPTDGLPSTGFHYFEKMTDSPCPAEIGPEHAVSSCYNLPPICVTGSYWIDPDAGSHDNAFKAYCDMDTSGSGWTLVYRYTFTNYNNFKTVTNAVTPIPNWTMVETLDSPVSTTPPVDESTSGAVPFTLWQEIGKEFLVKSNLAHWLHCIPGTGSLVTMIPGKVTCGLAKSVPGSSMCSMLPSSVFTLEVKSAGPALDTSLQAMYYWDGHYSKDWPVHDPCGAGYLRVSGEPNPYGAIYLRRP